MIFGKVGRIGHGKTMRAVVDAIELAQLRRAVLTSNIMLRAPAGIEHVLLPMDGFSEAFGELLDECQECAVCVELNDWGLPAHGGPGCERRGVVALVDEVDTIWDSREWQDMSKLDRFRIKQSRKLGCDLIWTAQFTDQVEKSIRNITEEVELLRAFPPPSLHRRERGKRPWFLVGSRFRPGALRELTASADPDKRLGRRFYRYNREHERLYNTDELVRPSERPARRRRQQRESAPEVSETPAAPAAPSPEGPQRSGGRPEAVDGAEGSAAHSVTFGVDGSAMGSRAAWADPGTGPRLGGVDR